MFKSKTLKLNNKNNLYYLTYNLLSDIPFINHAFSTKLGGVSKNEFESMNLAFNRGDSEENVTENYKIFCNTTDIEYKNLVASAQDHNTNIKVITSKDKGKGIYKKSNFKSVDGIITKEKDITLVTYYADCTPLFFIDTKEKAIGLAHAGWRGTVGEIGKKMIKEMKNNFNTNPENLICAIGPAIGSCCYEVDKPCAEQFLKLKNLPTETFVKKISSNKYIVDLLKANEEILVLNGVKKANITVSDICTKCNSHLLWSHRATNGKRGTMAAFLTLI